ncbi:glycine--tRNA ligase [Candidatus Uhrbacteria bacterium CG_4_9_14_0_2_um_filter_41_50]|uniref:Glycine--tRNA ligase n=1 Tax=Candidatus Uhrbacteria bacterium CG_4_9_14_0_2_um_filter_41_50 TaxID=1975031 RepID=A0A2M8ENT0_9BACT|nr:MAG: glycine--tRNA ligase [Candidatus Uhrbacteria bacterium CG_4_10_14_3_um_filter_41_21]PIZ55028.1 MAG: glycine--tRNA ligase [Candidatus Uhrbacteria bacterium CG_4_10_14_0_2_um_filter_41_21]PJB84466.1 MAG: glycine--tRNA ligase [Candidatus Uhrbacteria bacterium CG_4_9_14_0_8_um_filter_41_16]PJC24389.1 MAG: glycine--tRNA ligase [Candidatus Uhrbacteria bacterium CG_4_9_14_0_2_um_filter_41_50]PJE74835.1 MAG: glycine--tRNA ligase [Candidatus Uhrbacteria bacterium CG10_big_fil_rev_8_21_14_0_10_41
MSDVTMDKIVQLCKTRGFVFSSSEIYGGFAAVYDYGPLGVELANNVKRAWWKTMVQEREDIVGLDSSIFMSPRIWEASGHVGGFSDPLTECKKCHTRSRVDHLLEEIGIMADEKMTEAQINKLLDENAKKIKCPKCGKSDFSPAKSFNLLVKSNLGNFTGDDEDPVYLRGETCQGIYVNFNNVVDSMHVKIPFGIAQIGKAFRNEITARQFIFRTREFEQMEMQYFVHPNDEMRFYNEWKEKRMQFYLDLGINKENLKWHKHENLVFYAKEAYDIEYNFPFGWKELEGVHARGDYDLTQHSIHSGQKLEFMNQETKEKYTPHIVETSAGVARTMLAVLADAYTEEKVGDDIRVVLKLNKDLTPFKIAILPLSKKEELIKPAHDILNLLKSKYNCDFDITQSIGKRYRRQDEIGTPYCVTVDFDTLDDKKVTVRDRDTMKQERVAIDKLEEYFSEKF